MNFSKFKRTNSFNLLNEGQKRFFETFFDGYNVFLTGGAGTGKSFCIKTLTEFLKEEGIVFGLTASTGVAALAIDGSTIHSWAGIGLGDEDVDSILKGSLARNKKARKRIRDSRILIIDEISMVSGILLDKLNLIFQKVRFDSRPFGGIQVVFSGDFLQLPPVFKELNDNDFAFNSKSWKDSRIKPVILDKLVRQDGDSSFAKMLNEIRKGGVSSLGVLSSRIDAKFPEDGISPVRIYCKNIEVDSFNRKKLELISSPVKEFVSIDSGKDHHINFFDRNCPAPKNLTLKVGAQVMLLKNLSIENGMVNGSIGVVEGFTTEGVEVKFSSGRTLVTPDEWNIKEQNLSFENKIYYIIVATRIQIPLKLAWATTCHKIQGATLDRAEIDLNEAFAAGQAYVALSRVRNLESLSLKPFSVEKIIVNQRCLDFYEKSDKSAP